MSNRTWSILTSLAGFAAGMLFLVESALTKDDTWCGALILLGSACCALGLSMLFDKDHKFILAKGYHDDHEYHKQ